jgi:hypothetical protein
LVERNLAKVEVESSRLFSRSRQQHEKGSRPASLSRLRKHHDGAVAKRLCSGLQIRPGRFDSAPRLQMNESPALPGFFVNGHGGGWIHTQFSTVNPETRLNSASLLVTSVAASASAWQAIHKSLDPIGVPAAFS